MALLINGTPYTPSVLSQPDIRPAIDWLRDSAKRMNGRDYGAGQDKYFSEVSFFDTVANIDALQAEINANGRGTVVISGLTVGQEIFGPEVDYSVDIEAVIDPTSKRRYPNLGRLSQLGLRLRAKTPTLLGTTPSLATLRLQGGWEADSDLDLPTAFTYSQGITRLDRRVKGGGFKGRFLQTTTEARAIIAYLLTTARANTVAFPALDVTYPFGQPNTDGDHNCKIPNWKIRRIDLSIWEFEITFTPEGLI